MADLRRLYAEKTDAARQALSQGDREAATAAFLEALQLGEQCFGADHPSLGEVLNELSRLYIRQSQHARAQVVLERLVRITRLKGEQHPDVATALAGLALVKRALGEDAAAEQGFRDALRIRERALAPHHMATVVTMEQLSETCAARGNLSEALALLQRALPTREAALGADHATVRGLRSRIAALELRMSEANLATIERQIASLTRPDPSWDAMLSAPATEAVVETVAPATAAAVPPALVARRDSQPVRLPRRNRVKLYASAGVAVAVLATVGIGARSRSSDAGAGSPASQPTQARFAADPTAQTSNGAATLGVATMEAVLPGAPRPASDSSVGIVQAGAPMAGSAAPVAAPALPVVPKNLAAVTSRIIDKANVDSVVRASTLDRSITADRIGAGVGVVASSQADDAVAGHAALIAPAPLPRFPAELRAQWTESEVVVRFRVDEHGRVDVNSMKALKSDHELFTAAVRNVLPRFRFEPARSPAPESKPIADWVDFRVRFTAAK